MDLFRGMCVYVCVYVCVCVVSNQESFLSLIFHRIPGSPLDLSRGRFSFYPAESIDLPPAVFAVVTGMSLLLFPRQNLMKVLSSLAPVLITGEKNAFRPGSNYCGRFSVSSRCELTTR